MYRNAIFVFFLLITSNGPIYEVDICWAPMDPDLHVAHRESARKVNGADLIADFRTDSSGKFGGSMETPPKQHSYRIGPKITWDNILNVF